MTRSTLLSRPDLEFLLYDWLQVEALTKRERYAEHSRETFDAVLEVTAQIAAEKLAPHNRLGDVVEPAVVDGAVRLNPQVSAALDAIAEAGILGAGLDAAAGGLQLPQVVTTACSVWFAAANVGTWVDATTVDMQPAWF